MVTTIKLTPEELQYIKGGEAAPKPVSSGTDDMSDPYLSDLPVPTPDGGVLQPPTPSEGKTTIKLDKPLPGTTTKGSFIGLPTEKTVDAKGNARTTLEMRDGPSGLATNFFTAPIGAPIDAIMGEGAADRVIYGSGLEAIKSTLSLGEWLLDKAGVGDPTSNYINDNFATMPAANEFEKVAQEIGSIVIGSVAGANAASSISKTFGLAPKLSGAITQFWDKAKIIDPVNASAKLTTFIKSLLVETVGASVGATVTTPAGVESMSGSMGLLPEKMGNLSQEETNRVGHFIDNAAFSVGLIGLGKLFGAGKDFVVEKFAGGLKDKTKVTAVGNQLFKAIDPGITDDLSPEEFANRASILGEVLRKNKEFDTILSDTPIPLDSVSAMTTGAKAGAREYMERAYAFRKASMSPEEFEQMVNQQATEMVGNMMAIKQGMKEHAIVRNSDANFMDATGSAIKGAANNLATPAEGNLAGQQLGQPIVDDLTAARETMSNAATQKIQAEQNVATRAADNEMLSALEGARANNQLPNPQDMSKTRDQIAGSVLGGQQEARAIVNEKFASIPNEKVDANALAEAVQAAGDQLDILRAFGIVDGQMPVGKMPNPDEDLALTAENIMNKGYDNVRTLISEVRPRLVSMKDDYLTGQNPQRTKADQIDILIKTIDDQIGKSTNVAVIDAFDEYARYADRYLTTPELRKIEATASQVHPTRNGMYKGVDDAYRATLEALDSARTSSDPNALEKYLAAAQAGSTTPVGPMYAGAIVGNAMRVLASTTSYGKRVTPEMFTNAMGPLLREIQIADPTTYAKVQEVFEIMRQGDQELMNADEVAKKAESVYQLLLTKSQREAAANFVNDIAGDPTVLQDTGAAFRKIFSRPNSPELVDRLLQQASDQGNELAVRGIKSEYMRFLNDTIFTSKPIDMRVTAEGTEAVTDASGAKLRDILEGSGSSQLTTLQNVFKDDPKTAEALYDLMTVMHNQVNSRATKANPFGSNTAIDQQLQRNLNVLITVTLGVLNPVATKARALTGAMIDGKSAKTQDAIKAIMAQMVTDPSFLANSLELLAKDATGKTFEKMLQRSLATANNLMYRGVLGTTKPQDTPIKDDPVDQQTTEAFRVGR